MSWALPGEDAAACLGDGVPGGGGHLDTRWGWMVAELPGRMVRPCR